MSGRVGTDERGGEPESGAIVPTVGFVVAAIATLGPLFSLRQGVTEPAIWAATAAGGLAALAFLARRHGALGRPVGSPIAAVASGVAVLLAGYVIATGIADSMAVSGIGRSGAIGFASLLAAGTAVGVGVADYAGISGSGLQRRARRFLEMLVLGFVGLAAIVVVGALGQLSLYLLVGEPTDLQLQVLSYVSLGVGFGAVAIGYCRLRGYGLAFVDLEVPTRRQVLWTIGGLVAIYAASVGLSVLLALFGAGQATHGTVESARENAEILVVIIPAMVLIVGPAEELLYRNVIQKTLYGTFSRYGAVVVTSVVFASVHVLAFPGGNASQVLTSLVVVFALSLVLGTIYERTENLVIPALVHGLYNVSVFAPLLL